jgi:hypothetical protein
MNMPTQHVTQELNNPYRDTGFTQRPSDNSPTTAEFGDDWQRSYGADCYTATRREPREAGTCPRCDQILNPRRR